MTDITTVMKGMTVSVPKGERRTQMLWTEKYRPTTVKDMIGMDSIFEELEAWWELWEKGNKMRAKRSKKVENTRKYAGYFRAAMLVGDPGTGKTTAARNFLRHKGYIVHEFNSSDVRTGKRLIETVRPIIEAVETTSLGKHALLMDEIDGLDSGDRGGLKTLIKLLNPTKGGGRTSDKLKLFEAGRYTCPVICICNYGYPAKIKSLSTVCYPIKCDRPNKVVLFDLMRRVIKEEKLTITREQQLRFVESAGGDFRTLLNLIYTRGVSVNGSIGGRKAGEIRDLVEELKSTGGDWGREALALDPASYANGYFKFFTREKKKNLQMAMFELIPEVVAGRMGNTMQAWELMIQNLDMCLIGDRMERMYYSSTNHSCLNVSVGQVLAGIVVPWLTVHDKKITKKVYGVGSKTLQTFNVARKYMKKISNTEGERRNAWPWSLGTEEFGLLSWCYSKRLDPYHIREYYARKHEEDVPREFIREYGVDPETLSQIGKSWAGFDMDSSEQKRIRELHREFKKGMSGHDVVVEGGGKFGSTSRKILKQLNAGMDVGGGKVSKKLTKAKIKVSKTAVKGAKKKDKKEVGKTEGKETKKDEEPEESYIKVDLDSLPSTTKPAKRKLRKRYS